MKNFTKIFFLSTIIFFSTTNFSFSQIMFGPRIGLNYSTVSGVNVNAGWKPGLHVGGYVRIGSEKVAFQPEVLFSMKGYAFNGGGWTERQSLNYIDIPLLVAFGRNFKFLMGVQPSILMGAKYKYKSGSSSTTTDNKNILNSLDMAGVLGFEYELKSGLNFGYRFGIGFMRVYEPDFYKTILNVNMQVTVGYTIGKD